MLINSSCTCRTRIHKAQDDGEEVVDIDGSYLYKKVQQLNNSGVHTEPPDLPSSAPISGWEALTEATIGEISQKLPCVTSGMVYSYLSKETCQDDGRSTFRALARGYTHWASGRINTISVNLQHPINCHVESVMRPSMKAGSYRVWIMLGKDDLGYAYVMRATCGCAAG